MNKLILMLFLALAVSACSGPMNNPDAQDASAAPAEVESVQMGPLPEVAESAQRRMTFINSSVFDRDMAASMRNGYHQIVVKVAGSVSLDVIPDRIEKWLSAIQESDGQVQAEALPDPNAPVTRSAELIALIQVAVSYFSEKREDPNYEPAGDYHARIYYHADTGNVTQVVFHRR